MEVLEASLKILRLGRIVQPFELWVHSTRQERSLNMNIESTKTLHSVHVFKSTSAKAEGMPLKKAVSR
jgi:hypothetical protein